MEDQSEFGIATAWQIIFMRSYAGAAFSGLPIPCTMIDHISVFEAVSQIPIFMLLRAGNAEWMIVEMFPFLKCDCEVGKAINIVKIKFV
jgi:hypothetical protein